MHAWTREYLTQMEYVDRVKGDDAFNGIDELLLVPDETAISLSQYSGLYKNGIVSNDFKLLLNEHPDLPSTSEFLESEKTSGESDVTEEDIQITVRKPSEFTLDVDANAYISSYFFTALLQNGYSELDELNWSVTGKVRNYEDYKINRYLAFICSTPKLNNSKNQNVLVRAAVPRNIRLSCKTGQVLRMSVEVMAGYWTNQYNLENISNYPSRAVPSRIASLRWQNASVWIDDAYVVKSDTGSGLKLNSIVDATNRIALEEFDLNITNNLVAKFYNAEVVQCFVLGKIRANGNLKIPWVLPVTTVDKEALYYWSHINDFRNNTVKRIRIQWGTTFENDIRLSDKALIIEAYIKYTDGQIDSEEDLNNSLPFLCVRPDSTTPAFQIRFGYFRTETDGIKIARRTPENLTIVSEVDSNDIEFLAGSSSNISIGLSASDIDAMLGSSSNISIGLSASDIDAMLGSSSNISSSVASS